MGKGAHVRIINRSTRSVVISIEERTRVDNRGIENLQGEVGVGAQLPSKEGGTEVYGGRYEYIEGEPSRRFHKDGYFHLVAKHGDANVARVQLFCDRDAWWAKNSGADDEKTPVLVMSADVEEEDDGKYRIDIKVHDYIPTERWMEVISDVIVDKALCGVALPGTHDSGSYEFNEELGASPDSDLTTNIQDKLEFGRGIIRKLGERINDGILRMVFARLCQCQDRTITEQLKEGIRYLDLRLASHGEDQFYTCHGVYCCNLETILDDINTFLDAHPKEIVILDFNHFYAMNASHHEKCAALIQTKLAGKIADQKAHELRPNSKVRQYWEKKAQAVVIYHDLEVHKASDGKLWFRGCIDSKWPEANETTLLKTKLKSNLEGRADAKFFVLQGVLTPDGELIKDEILESKGSMSIKTIAARASQKVTNWVEDEWNTKTHNIVMVDFFNDCSMVTSIINLNKRQ